MACATDGTKKVLGMWIAENEGASFWATVFNGLKALGVEDIPIAVTDGLSKGMTEALETVYPQTLHQTCIVHLIRASTSFVSHKDRAAVCKELKPILSGSGCRRCRTRSGALWEHGHGQEVPCHHPDLATCLGNRQSCSSSFLLLYRTLIYTTNAIEGLNRAIRKVIKTRTLFPNEDAAKKLIYLAIMNFTASWKRAMPKWAAAMPQFALLFGERFTGAME
ncbi:MAG: transposase [Holdemanella sp.]